MATDATAYIERFWGRVDKSSDCWLWTGARSRSGYGRVWWLGRTARAHRVAFLLAGGRIPFGLELDHLCGQRLCVRPLHLQPTTHRINVRRIRLAEPVQLSLVVGLA